MVEHEENIDLDAILGSRLSDLADQFLKHEAEGDEKLARIVEAEAMSLCEAADSGQTFLFLPYFGQEGLK